MTLAQIILLAAAVGTAAVLAAVAWQVRRKNLQHWLGSFVRQSLRGAVTRARAPQDVHVLLCIADHFEPAGGGVGEEVADARVAAWQSDYPKALGSFRDSDGRPPRHTFFYPLDEYEPRRVDAIAGLCRAGYGEVEIHLHHHDDTAENLEATLTRFTALLSERHGLLGRTPDGRVAYGFVHGNWALDNSRPDGCWCGVRNELDVLKRTGCYADFTLPSAPDATQTRKINSIYYAVGDASRTKSHDRGIDVGSVAIPPAGGLMLIQGPLRLWRPRGSWRVRIENACVQRGQPPTSERLDQWIRANVRVPQRVDWIFVKLHTHGATEANRQVLLGEAMGDFHRELARRAEQDRRFHYHYVTAREMFNLAKAAEAGWTGAVAAALDYHVARPGAGKFMSKTVQS